MYLVRYGNIFLTIESTVPGKRNETTAKGESCLIQRKKEPTVKKIKILDISDMQNGFTRTDGNLYIPGAEEIIAPINDFLQQVRYGVFDVTLVVLDTHFAEEYSQTEESTQFPIHCEYGTRDWGLSVDVLNLPNKQYVMKNRFDMWSEKQVRDIPFTDPKRKTAYDNLFYILDNPYEPTKRATRDDFLKTLCPDNRSATLDVTILGVASDYCNRYAMEGWLSRGASVTIIQDLTKGIEKETQQILEEYHYRHYGYSRLRSVDSTDYLRELARIHT